MKPIDTAKSNSHSFLETSKVTIRSADFADLDSIMKLENEMWVGNQRCSRENFLERLAIYREGFLLAHDNNGRLCGTFFCVKRRYVPKKSSFSWYSESANGTGKSHEPSGNALFGMSVTVYPSAPKGTLRSLFDGWRDLARAEGLAFIYGGSRIPGLIAYSGSATDYLNEVRKKSVFDPVLSKYMACGLKVGELIPNYFEDPESVDFGVEVYDIIL